MPPALDWLDSQAGEEIGLSGFVIMELLQGCRNQTEQSKLERELYRYRVVWPAVTTCEKALVTFAHCRLSHGLTMLDVLIGHTAVELDSPLFTFNQKHYRAVPDLKTVQPYVRGSGLSA